MRELMNELRMDGNMNTLARKSCFFFFFQNSFFDIEIFLLGDRGREGRLWEVTECLKLILTIEKWREGIIER